MVPVYKVLLQRGLSILVYSGDVDAIVPVRIRRLTCVNSCTTTPPTLQR